MLVNKALNPVEQCMIHVVFILEPQRTVVEEANDNVSGDQIRSFLSAYSLDFSFFLQNREHDSGHVVVTVNDFFK